MKKITGSLQEKNGKYYAVVNHYDGPVTITMDTKNKE